MGDVINLKEWKKKKKAELYNDPVKYLRSLDGPLDVNDLFRWDIFEDNDYEGKPLEDEFGNLIFEENDAFEMAQIMYDSRKDRLAEEQENLDDALDSLNESVKILEEASTKVLEDAKKRT